MRNMALTILTIIAVILFIVHQKGWISDRFLNRIVSIATIIAAMAALMVFFIPAAQEQKTNAPPEMPKISSPQTSDTNTKERHIYEQKPMHAPEVTSTDKSYVKSESNLTSSINKTVSDHYPDTLYLEANDKGSVIVRGHNELSKLIQFCPDEWADDCEPNIVIKRKGDIFSLDKEAMARHQNAFNLQDANGLWLQIKSNNVYVGSNLVINNGNNGKYFVYGRRVTN